MLKKTSQKGFTIVELLIVIVVIGILAALVLNTFSGVQRRARDTERQTDLNSVATQLEVYYNENGKYPTLGNMQDSAVNPDGWVKTNLKGLDLNALIAPGNTVNSVVDDTTPDRTHYGYVPTDSGGGTCDNTVTLGDCVKFVLYWAKEDAADAAQSKASLN